MKKLLLILPFFLSFYGFGQFSPPNDISKSLITPSAATLIDIDYDGDLDVITQSSGYPTWYENLGAGIFSTKKTLVNKLHSSVNQMFMGDFDNDGLIDILQTKTNAGEIVWYKNLGGGAFDPIAKPIATYQNFYSDYATDIDNDNDLDVLAYSIVTDTLVWHENLGNGLFNTVQQGIAGNINIHYSSSLRAADIDGDNDYDIITGSNLDNEVVWHENLGGNFAAKVKVSSFNFGYGQGSVDTADIDNDGDIDLLITQFHNDQIGWYMNVSGVIDTNQHLIDTPNGPGFSTASDIDNDGDLDVISAIHAQNKIVWYENLGAGVFGVQQLITNKTIGAIFVQAGDIDNDGDLDVVSTSQDISKIAWYENLGAGVFGAEQIIGEEAKEAFISSISDVDNDGDNDVIVASYGDEQIVWYENLGLIGFGKEIIISSNMKTARDVISVDIDNDSDMDIVTVSEDDDKIIWFENIAGVFDSTQNIVSTNMNQPYSIRAFDIDNDGDMDLLSASPGDDLIKWFENVGGVIDTTQNIILHPLSLNVTCAEPADIDNDGDDDIVATLHASLIVWFENIGGIIDTSYNLISNNTLSASSIKMADLDNDGNIDVIIAAIFGNKIVWHQNIGGGVFGTEQLITNNLNSPRFVNAYDVDGDGDIDVLSASENDDKLALYENLGGGVFSTQNIISNSFDGSSSVVSGDIDNDGDLDIVATAPNDDLVAWFENFYSNPKLKGKIFYDANQNKLLDSNERGFQAINTQLQPTALYSYSDSLGNYFFTVDSGIYTVSYVPDSLWGLTTDSMTYTRTLTSLYQVEDSLNFGFYPDTVLTIIQPDITGSFPRCNDTVNYWVNIQNQGTTLPSGIIHLQLDDSIIYISSAITPDSINGQNIYWHYDSLFFFDSEMINLQVLMPPFTSMGDTLSSYLTVYEIDTFNNIVYTNTDTLEQVLVCAYDPNDKSVTPKGLGVEGFISQTQELEYLIRFQNTGNDTAITVMIRDQLDENLDWSTLQPIASSHNMQVWIEQDGEAVFKFKNIMLPDSGADFIGSQGFVKFSIQPDSGLAPLTPIYNTANIYFDFNPAVVTNTVLNTIECYSAPLPVISYNFPYLDAGVTGNYTYQWYLNDTLIVGATNDTLTPLVDGDYTVEVTDSNGCFKISLPYTHITVGLEEKEQLNTLVYPNPFRESTTILFSKKLNKDYDLLVYNIVGTEAIRINKIAGNRVNINKNDIGKGMFLTYLIHNQTGERIFIEKLIVQ